MVLSVYSNWRTARGLKASRDVTRARQHFTLHRSEWDKLAARRLWSTHLFTPGAIEEYGQYNSRCVASV